MALTIDRDTAIEALRKAESAYPSSFSNGLEVARFVILELPAVEVAHGRWLDYQRGQWIYAQCSECKTVHDGKSNFCPSCGKKMDLGVITND